MSRTIKASEFKAKCLAVLDEIERTPQPIVITKRGDPADRFIVATAIAHDAMLVTADDRLLQWRHGLRRHNAET